MSYEIEIISLNYLPFFLCGHIKKKNYGASLGLRLRCLKVILILKKSV
jgi:hypothetical protein